MRVGFDISQTAHPGGVATYTENLALELSKISDLEMFFFYSSLRKPYKGSLKNIKKFKLPPIFFEILFNKLRNVPIEKFIGDVDIFHSSDWIQPPTKAKKVTTYHDALPLKYPQWSHPKIVNVQKRRLQIVEREIDCVIAVSESTKKDLLNLSSIPEEKIKVIYEGVGEEFKPQYRESVSSFKKKYNLPNAYILSIAGVGERKNLSRIKEATKNYNLVILGENVKRLADEELPLLYSGAKVLLYPSLYEGFGLPILEAMACGTPVITSNTSSMPEVGENAVLYVDPESIPDISKKLQMVMEDNDLREDLIKKGFNQAKKFSWKKCAQETVEVYKKFNEKK